MDLASGLWGTRTVKIIHGAWLGAMGFAALAVWLATQAPFGVWLATMAAFATPGLLAFAPAAPERWAHSRRVAVWSVSLAMAGVLSGPFAAVSAVSFGFAVLVCLFSAPGKRYFEAPLFLGAGFGLALFLAPNVAEPAAQAASWAAGLVALAGVVGVGVTALNRVFAFKSTLVDEIRGLETLVANSSLAFLRLDTDGRVTRAYGPTAEFLGLDATQLSGETLDGLVDQASRETVIEVFARCVRSGRGVETYANALGRPVRLRFTLEDHGVALCVGRAGPSQAEVETLRRARDSAVSDAEAKSAFFAKLNHELRTPLNAILGFTDVMRQGVFGPLPDTYAEYVGMVHDSAEHLLDLVGSVIDLSKLEAGAYSLEPQRHDAREAIGTGVRMLGVLAEKAEVALIDASEDDPVWVNADERALRQIAINLIANAIKFTPAGGEVRARVGVEHGELVLDVADTGQGMAPEDVARLGLPYMQTETGRSSSTPGSGLGLAIVRGLAEMHGGRLVARSTLGQGSVIGIAAPVLAAAGGHVTSVGQRSA